MPAIAIAFANPSVSFIVFTMLSKGELAMVMPVRSESEGEAE